MSKLKLKKGKNRTKARRDRVGEDRAGLEVVEAVRWGGVWRRGSWWLGVLVGVLLVMLIEQGVCWAAGGGDISQVRSFASRLTNYVTAIAASVAVLFIAINGVRWTVSSGNPARQADAKSGLVAAAVGLAIALSANVIVNLVVAALH